MPPQTRARPPAPAQTRPRSDSWPTGMIISRWRPRGAGPRRGCSPMCWKKNAASNASTPASSGSNAPEIGLLAHWDDYLTLAAEGRWSQARLLTHVLEEECRLKREHARQLRLKRARDRTPGPLG